MGLILLNLSLGMCVALLFQTRSPSLNFVSTKRTGKRPRVFESDSEIEQPDPDESMPPPPSSTDAKPESAFSRTRGPRTSCQGGLLVLGPRVP